MKLLFDQNLAPRLAPLLAGDYPGSVHVRDVGLSTASDAAIWRYARHHGYVILSKDSDFQQQSLLMGHPPKFIWLRVGNCTVEQVHAVLQKHAASLVQFNQSASESHLMLP